MLKMIKGLIIFLMFLFTVSCKKDPPVVPPVVQQDTTSHAINWISMGVEDHSSTI